MVTILDRLLKKVIAKGIIEVIYPDGRTVRFGRSHPDYPEIAIRFADRRVARDIVADARLGTAEAYMDGRIEIERGDILGLAELVRSNLGWDGSDPFGPKTVPGRIRHAMDFVRRSWNCPASAKRNVAHHYDIGNDLYRMMLDREHMQYSCGYWPRDDMTLAEAQEAKLAHIASKLAIEPGMRVLDIGCGWGGMACYLASKLDVEVHGITLSEEQLALGRERAAEAGLSNKVRLELIDYRELAKRGRRYDRIVSVGMFEHVGRPQFATFFRACVDLLEEHGVMLVHTIGRMGEPGTTDAFTDKYIFPGGYIPALSEAVGASEKMGLIATDIETWRLHYAKTLREWYRRCVVSREAIVARYDDRFFRMWSFYLAGAITAFEIGGMCNYQIQYTRRRDAVPLTRDYMGENEAKLLLDQVA